MQGSWFPICFLLYRFLRLNSTTVEMPVQISINAQGNKINEHIYPFLGYQNLYTQHKLFAKFQGQVFDIQPKQLDLFFAFSN